MESACGRFIHRCGHFGSLAGASAGRWQREEAREVAARGHHFTEKQRTAYRREERFELISRLARVGGTHCWPTTCKVYAMPTEPMPAYRIGIQE